jgi:hypothetical protein
MEQFDALVEEYRKRGAYPARPEDRAAAPPGQYVNAETIATQAGTHVRLSGFKVLEGEVEGGAENDDFAPL